VDVTSKARGRQKLAVRMRREVETQRIDRSYRYQQRSRLTGQSESLDLNKQAIVAVGANYMLDLEGGRWPVKVPF
jgi:predicted RNA binding protein with dsRBD fold (UPF0201 family)